MFRHILCATDLSPSSDEALRLAVHMSAKYDAQLTVLNVHEEFMDKEEMVMLRVSVEQMQERFREVAVTCKEQMAELVTAVGVDDIEVEYLIREGEPKEEILAMADSLAKDLSAPGVLLTVIGVGSRESLVEHLLGSVTDHVVRHSNGPVLVIPYVEP